MTQQLIGTIYGLLSALSFGAGDFSGGLATKKTAVYTVLLFAQTVGIILLTLLAILFKEPSPQVVIWIYGGAAGICGTIGLGALYTGLSRSKMGVMAPLTGVITTIIPILVGLFLEGLPTTTQTIGFILALIAVWLLSTGEASGRIVRSDFKLALIAGLGFSLFFVFIDQAGNQNAVFWPLVASRIASIVLLLVFTLYRGNFKTISKATAVPIFFAGILDSLGNLFFALATQISRLDVATVLSSLYPASTIFLAWLMLNETLSRTQWVGAILALIALLLVAL